MRAVPLLGLLCWALAGAPLCSQAHPPAAREQAFAEANRSYRAGDVAATIALLEPLRGDPGVGPPILALLAAAYLDGGRPQDAADVLSPLAERADAGPAVLFNAARAALALGDEDRAETYLERAVAIAPRSQAARALGLNRGRQSRFEEALELLSPWVAAHPDDREARLAAAFAALEVGRPAEVAPLVAGLGDDDPAVRLLTARAELAQGNPRGAVERLAPVADSPPAELARDLWATLAEARLQVGEAAAAVELLGPRAGDDPMLALKLAQAYQQSGRPQEVLTAVAPLAARLATPAEIPPAERPLYAGLAAEHGRALIGLGRWEEAAAALRAATTLAPEDPLGWQLLAQALRGAGRAEDAAAALARFRDLSGRGGS